MVSSCNCALELSSASFRDAWGSALQGGNQRTVGSEPPQDVSLKAAEVQAQ